MAFKIEVNQKKCAGCEACVDNCTQQVITMIRGKAVVVNEAACLGCGTCVEGCKRAAIALKELGVNLSATMQSLLRNCPGE